MVRQIHENYVNSMLGLLAALTIAAEIASMVSDAPLTLRFEQRIILCKCSSLDRISRSFIHAHMFR
jgi:hypothetical protein